MHDWTTRPVSADEAVSGLANGMNVFVHGAAATPTPLLEALRRAQRAVAMLVRRRHLQEGCGTACRRTPRSGARPGHCRSQRADAAHTRQHARTDDAHRHLDAYDRDQLGARDRLSGQVVADSIGFRIYSGIGGQMDFMRGAALSKGGKPIIAMPSTAAGEPHRIGAQAGRGRGDDAGARPLGGDRIRGREPLRGAFARTRHVTLPGTES
jgi:hypothetical protein